MDASGKPNRGSKGGIGVIRHSLDRLSALPDDLLHAVLSRLKARQVVRTCVLSTRWRHLWRTVPCLRIDQREFDGPFFTDERQSFKNFAYILLHDHDVELLEEFRLHVCCGGGMRRHADGWVRRGISQDEKWFCGLKKLHLTNVFVDDHFTIHINFSCPHLEDMRLKNCSYSLAEDTEFTSDSLEKLVIVGVREAEGYWWLHAPALASLTLDCGYLCDGVSINILPSLIDASISMTVSNDNGIKNCPLTDLQLQIHFLWCVSNVTTLHLSRFGVLFPFDDCVGGMRFPQFEKLKTLSLVECDISDDFQTLEHFLQNSPNLEKLTLNCCKLLDPMPRNDTMESARRCSEDIESVNCQNLRLTEIIYRDDEDDVPLLVKFLMGMWRNMPNNKIEITKFD